MAMHYSLRGSTDTTGTAQEVLPFINTKAEWYYMAVRHYHVFQPFLSKDARGDDRQVLAALAEVFQYAGILKSNLMKTRAPTKVIRAGRHDAPQLQYGFEYDDKTMKVAIEPPDKVSSGDRLVDLVASPMVVRYGKFDMWKGLEPKDLDEPTVMIPALVLREGCHDQWIGWKGVHNENIESSEDEDNEGEDNEGEDNEGEDNEGETRNKEIE